MKRAIALVLFAAVCLSLIPVAMAAQGVSSVNVYNYNRVGKNQYDPKAAVSRDFAISGAYDDIAKSAPYSLASAPNYRVVFSLREQLASTTRLTMNGSSLAKGTNRVNGIPVIVDSFTVTAIFTARRGGNTQTFTLGILDSFSHVNTTQSATVSYYDSAAAYAPAGTDMNVTAASGGNHGSVWVDGQNLHIEYDSLYHPKGSTMKVSLDFTDANGYRIPSTGSAALKSVTSNGAAPLISAYLYDLSYQSRGQFDGTLSTYITIDTTNTAVSFAVEHLGKTYTSPTYNVIWRDMRTNESSVLAYADDNVLTINPSRSPTIMVGQDYTFTISSAEILTTGAYFSLDVAGQGSIVSLTGKYLTIRGDAPGQTTLNVRDSYSKILATIPVTVVGYGTAIEAETTAVYQVTAPTLEVRTGPGIGYTRVGEVTYGQFVTVFGFQDGWARVSWMDTSYGYVDSGRLVYVSGTVSGWAPGDSYHIPMQGVGSQDYSMQTKPTASTGYQTGQMPANPTYYNVNGGTYMSVTADYASVYAGPGRDYTQTGVAARGQRVYVTSISNTGWASVQWGEGSGYMNAAYLW